MEEATSSVASGSRWQKRERKSGRLLISFRKSNEILFPLDFSPDASSLFNPSSFGERERERNLFVLPFKRL